MAAWLALDPCDEANGCLQVVPGSHTWPLLCTERADTSKSFTNVTVPLPEGTPVEPVIMDAGDVMFFNGSLVHGSFPNTTADRFRRSLIGHYVEGNAEQVSSFYSDALRMDGTPIHIEGGSDGGACGVWVDQDGAPAIQMTRRRAEEVTLTE
jgi:ectoine hydroxylase-related dioxygenase (phytanoyl-CoA dioxygenase family)